jgi:hypothetical protein
LNIEAKERERNNRKKITSKHLSNGLRRDDAEETWAPTFPRKDLWGSEEKPKEKEKEKQNQLTRMDLLLVFRKHLML